jgi:hypothetical protein
VNGAERIAKERRRQVRSEYWSAGHDDEHDRAEMALAAVCYTAQAAGIWVNARGRDPWPWDSEWDKRIRTVRDNLVRRPATKDRIRLLEKAGALIAAEIDRLLRVQSIQAGQAAAKARLP